MNDNDIVQEARQVMTGSSRAALFTESWGGIKVSGVDFGVSFGPKIKSAIAFMQGLTKIDLEANCRVEEGEVSVQLVAHMEPEDYEDLEHGHYWDANRDIIRSVKSKLSGWDISYPDAIKRGPGGYRVGAVRATAPGQVGAGSAKTARKQASSSLAQGQLSGILSFRLRWPRTSRTAGCSSR